MPFNVGGQILNSAQLKYYNDTNIVRNGLTFYLDGGLTNSYPGSGTSWFDLSGNNYTATLINGPIYKPAGGGSIVFDATDDWADAYPSPGLTGTGNWTMMAWFRVNGAPSNATYGNVIIDTDATGGSANMICVDWGGGFGGAQNQLLYGTRPSTGGSYTWLAGPVLTQSIWYQAAVVRNGTSDTKLYVNGLLSATYSGNMATATQPLVRLGRWTDGTVYSNINIANAQIYNRVLSASEILQNYQALKQRVSPDTIGTQANPAVSATQMYNLGYRTDGTYWLKPPASATAFQAYVDFTTTGGPWVHIGSVVDDGSTSNTAYHVWGAPFNPPQDTGIWQDSSTYGTLSLTTNFKSLGWSTISFTQLLIKDQGNTQRNLLYTNSGQVSAASFSSWIGSLSWAAVGSDTSNAAVAAGRVTNLAITNFGVNDDVLQSSGKSRLLFKWGEADGAQDGNKDRVMIAWDRSDAADTVDAPTGLGTFTNRSGTIDYRNITPGAYYGNTADFPPASIIGAPYYYTLWVKN